MVDWVVYIGSNYNRNGLLWPRHFAWTFIFYQDDDIATAFVIDEIIKFRWSWKLLQYKTDYIFDKKVNASSLATAFMKPYIKYPHHITVSMELKHRNRWEGNLYAINYLIIRLQELKTFDRNTCIVFCSQQCKYDAYILQKCFNLLQCILLEVFFSLNQTEILSHDVKTSLKYKFDSWLVCHLSIKKNY